MSIIASAQRKGLIEDAWIVPVGISYEKLVEGEYVWENLGRPKIPESLLGTLQGILRIITSSYGNIRVDFGQPCLLKVLAVDSSLGIKFSHNSASLESNIVSIFFSVCRTLEK